MTRPTTTKTVGGGLYKRVRLLEGERVLGDASADKKYMVPFATSMWGRLFLTDQRLIFLPAWYLPPSWLERPDCLQLGDVKRLERIAKPWYAMWWGFAKTEWWIFTTERRQVRYHIEFEKEPFHQEMLVELARLRRWEFQDRRTGVTS